MKRLFWVGVGVGLTVLVIKRGHELVERYVPADAAAAIGTATQVTRTARGVWGEFSAGLAEREHELRTALVGDADLADVRARGRGAWDDLRGARRPAADRRGRVPSEWAEGPLEDPDDDDGYAFF
jgi:hypothetical protein